MSATGQFKTSRRKPGAADLRLTGKSFRQWIGANTLILCLSSLSTADVLQNRLPLPEVTGTTLPLEQKLPGTLGRLPDQTMRATLSQLEGLLHSRLIGLGGVALNNTSSLTEETPLQALLQNIGGNCEIRQPTPLSFNFGALMPSEPSASSNITYHFSVDCKRPAAYRIVIVDARQQQLYSSFLPANIVQADGTRSGAAVFLSLDGKPLGAQFRNGGVNPTQHALSAELRTAPQIPITPRRAGSIELGLESAALTLIEFGLLQ